LLVDMGRIDLDIRSRLVVRRFLDRRGTRQRRSAIGPPREATSFTICEHRDPADRLLIATAIELACPLVTYDQRIAHFGKKHGRQYGFAIET